MGPLRYAVFFLGRCKRHVPALICFCLFLTGSATVVVREDERGVGVLESKFREVVQPVVSFMHQKILRDWFRKANTQDTMLDEFRAANAEIEGILTWWEEAYREGSGYLAGEGPFVPELPRARVSRLYENRNGALPTVHLDVRMDPVKILEKVDPGERWILENRGPARRADLSVNR